MSAHQMQGVSLSTAIHCRNQAYSVFRCTRVSQIFCETNTIWETAPACLSVRIMMPSVLKKLTSFSGEMSNLCQLVPDLDCCALFRGVLKFMNALSWREGSGPNFDE